ncbi:MAG: VCBS repeat-containing protein [Flavobacteriaceae bacterium]
MNRLLGILFLTLVTACGEKDEKLFQPISPQHSNITFNNQLTDTPKLNILTYLYYYNGAGVCTADFNNDGLIDLYFTGNQVRDRLYLNKGHLVFEDITEKAHIIDDGNWSTGVAHVDINGDGLLDIYICKAAGYRALTGKNLLYINQGTDKNGIPTFTEEAARYGLDFSGLSTQAAFFDYDLDGDLDMYLLNHSVHPNRAYGKGHQRMALDSRSGDRLYRNDDGSFVDVSAEAGIFQGKIGYGLGLGISDLDNDGYPDIYVGNDFYENDYLYMNQRNGTFQEVNTQNPHRLGHTTHFSMGNDMADINNDGLVDIISMDMLPEDLETYKASGTEYAYPIYQQYLRNGYGPQYMQNTLHLNYGEANFAEMAFATNIAATEWSWAPLIADFDNDGLKDLFVSNGIMGATNDMDYMNFIANEDIQRRIDAGMKPTDMSMTQTIPEKKVPNYFFKNQGDLSFKDVSGEWSSKNPTFSNGSAYADLDNDGDLDLVVNNVNSKALILENKGQHGNYLKIDFEGNAPNTFGIGAKVIVRAGPKTIVQENFTTRGYLSSIPPELHIGLGKDSIVDSMEVHWPDGTVQILTQVSVNQQVRLSHANATDKGTPTVLESPSPFAVHDSLIPFSHREKPSLDFDREPLVPFANSNQGPCISVSDVNGDGLQDVFVGGAKTQASKLFIQQQNGGFVPTQEDLFTPHAMNEDTASLFFDANGDGQPDLVVASGGNEFKDGPPLRPRLYLNHQGTFKVDTTFPALEINASKIITSDIDKDGDRDLVITSDQVPSQYGKTPRQFLLRNDGLGRFTDVTDTLAPDFKKLGNVRDAIFVDLNGDGYEDIIAVGHWMAVSVLINHQGSFKQQIDNGLKGSNGLWNTILANDFDKDGDMDVVVGNWGTNTKFNPNAQAPLTLYRSDFDGNGTIEPLVTYFHKDKETPFASKDELVKQMPFLNKKFLSYTAFAKASLDDLFTAPKLQNADTKKVFDTRSIYFGNDGKGNFTGTALPSIAQASNIMAMVVDDFDKDGFPDLFIHGNNHEISTQLGRLDAFQGLFLYNDQKGGFVWQKDLSPKLHGQVRAMEKMTIGARTHYVLGFNNGRVQTLHFNVD